MKRSGKLLDAIGYIDDRYIMEAADITSQKAAEKPGKKARTVPMRWQKRAAAGGVSGSRRMGYGRRGGNLSL